MDYKRKKRNVTYFSPACKMYLRHDFKHTCAYCGIVEENISECQEIAESYFEKDHFLPQKGKMPELHRYSNLFYACKKCNGKKDALVLPLNPCIDDIYGGNTPHIGGGTAQTNFMLESSTTKGKNYIEALELNSRYHVAIRKEQQERLQADIEARRIINELRENKTLDERVLKLIEMEMHMMSTPNEVKYICGCSDYGVYFAAVYDYLVCHGYKCEIILEDNEMDMKVVAGGMQYWGQLLPTNNAKQCRIKIEKLREWKKRNVPCAVLRYIPAKRVVRLYKIDFNKIDWNRKIYCVEDYIEL